MHTVLQAPPSFNRERRVFRVLTRAWWGVPVGWCSAAGRTRRLFTSAGGGGASRAASQDLQLAGSRRRSGREKRDRSSWFLEAVIDAVIAV